MNIFQEVASFVGSIRYEDLPPAVVHETKRLILDSVGCAIGGIHTRKGEIALRLSRSLEGLPRRPRSSWGRLKKGRAGIAPVEKSPLAPPAARKKRRPFRPQIKEVICTTGLGYSTFEFRAIFFTPERSDLFGSCTSGGGVSDN